MAANHKVRKFIDLVRQACGKWSNWDPPFPVFVGDYGTFNDQGELTVDGNIYDDAFQKTLSDIGLDIDLKSHPPEVAEATEDLIVSSHSVRKEEFKENQHVNAPGTEISLLQGMWKFPVGKRGALIILLAPRQVRISKNTLEKLLDERLLKGKYLITSVLACPAYLMYLSDKSGETLSVSLSAKPAGLSGINLGEWWTDKETDYLRTTIHPNAKYRFTPLFSLQQIRKRPWSVWKKEEGASDFAWSDVYPTWKPLDDDGEEYEDD